MVRYLKESGRIGHLICWILFALLAVPPAAWPDAFDDPGADASRTAWYAEASEIPSSGEAETTDMPGDDPAGVTYNPDGRLIYFAATGSTTRNVVTVQWETRVEPLISGYFVWRSEKRDGAYARLHHHMIASRGGDTWGGFYTFEDYGVVSGRIYYYQVQEIEESGFQRFYGPVASDGSIDWHYSGDKDRVNISCFIDALF